MKMIPAEVWQLDKVVDLLKKWPAVGVAYYKGETGVAVKIERRGRVWYSYTKDVYSPEQVSDLEKKAACALTYKTVNTAGTLYLLLVPKDQSKQGCDELIKLVEGAIKGGNVHHKGQRPEN